MGPQWPPAWQAWPSGHEVELQAAWQILSEPQRQGAESQICPPLQSPSAAQLPGVQVPHSTSPGATQTFTPEQSPGLLQQVGWGQPKVGHWCFISAGARQPT